MHRSVGCPVQLMTGLRSPASGRVRSQLSMEAKRTRAVELFQILCLTYSWLFLQISYFFSNNDSSVTSMPATATVESATKARPATVGKPTCGAPVVKTAESSGTCARLACKSVLRARLSMIEVVVVVIEVVDVVVKVVDVAIVAGVIEVVRRAIEIVTVVIVVAEIVAID